MVELYCKVTVGYYPKVVPDPVPKQASGQPTKFAFKVFCQLGGGRKRNLVLSADTERERLECVAQIQQLMAGRELVPYP